MTFAYSASRRESSLSLMVSVAAVAAAAAAAVAAAVATATVFSNRQHVREGHTLPGGGAFTTPHIRLQ